MRLLLDTHVLLWWVTGDRRLVKSLRAAIASRDNDVAVSTATFWEIAIKKQLGRIALDLQELVDAVRADGFAETTVTAAHTLQIESLPLRHRDPFDRMLIAQAIVEGRRFVTRDGLILAYTGIPGFEPFSA